MIRIFSARGMALSLATLLLVGIAGCDRGKFGPNACDSDKRVDVGANAVLAVYYDINGQEVGTDGEDMFGTKDNKMCPAPADGGTGGCAAGKCPVGTPGRTYCVTCP